MQSAQSEAALRQAVEEQLDLILKIEEERKLLKRENKVLKEEHQKMLKIVKKYQQPQKIDKETETDSDDIKVDVDVVEKEKQKVEMIERHVQVDLQPVSTLNVSKLIEAQGLLKQSAITRQVCLRCEENRMNEANREEPKRKNNSNSQQVGGQIVKMVKEIAALKRQLSQSQKANKGRDKELREVKRCLQVKSEALQKSRKDFNDLSQVFNTDKYKSVKLLGQQLTKTKTKLAVIQEQSKYSSDIRRTLQEVTVQYEQYRQDREWRIQSLLSELKEKDSHCEELSREMDSMRLESSRV